MHHVQEHQGQGLSSYPKRRSSIHLCSVSQASRFGFETIALIRPFLAALTLEGSARGAVA
eukprot:2718971-Rhodomonas_salina.2